MSSTFPVTMLSETCSLRSLLRSAVNSKLLLSVRMCVFIFFGFILCFCIMFHTAFVSDRCIIYNIYLLFHG